MPEYLVHVELVDSMGRRGRKSYLTQASVIDHAAAVTAANTLLTHLVALTEMEVLAFTVGLRTVYADSFTAGANRDEGATFTLNKVDNYRAVHRVPAPVAAVRNVDGTIDVTDAIVTDYFGNFLAGGDFTVSDGEVVESIIKGTVDV